MEEGDINGFQVRKHIALGLFKALHEYLNSLTPLMIDLFFKLCKESTPGNLGTPKKMPCCEGINASLSLCYGRHRPTASLPPFAGIYSCYYEKYSIKRP